MGEHRELWQRQNGKVMVINDTNKEAPQHSHEQREQRTAQGRVTAELLARHEQQH